MNLSRRILASFAVVALLAAVAAKPAEAHLISLGTYFLASPLGSPSAEAAWIESVVSGAPDLTYLNKWDGESGFDNVPPGAVDEIHFDVDPGGESSTQTIEWDLTGTGYSALYVLIKDGEADDPSTPSDHTKLAYYRLYEVSSDQTIIGGPDEVAFTSPAKDISHISWYGVVSSVPDGGATIMLLGTALVGLGALRRKFQL
jgi:hypothetical protein